MIARRLCLQNCCLLACVILIPGCGKSSAPQGPPLVPVVGALTHQGKPLAGADIFFFPGETTDGVGGRARSDEAGKFQVMYGRGGTGLPAGPYRVAVSLRIMPDGTPVPPNDETPPIESPARETLPPKYSNPEQSELKVVVTEGVPIEIVLDAKGSPARK